MSSFSLVNGQISSSSYSRLPYSNMVKGIFIREATEAGVVFVVTTTALAPFLHWMIKAKPRKTSRRRIWALFPKACILSGTGLIYVALFGNVRDAHSLGILACSSLKVWKGPSIRFEDIFEVFSIQARIVIFLKYLRLAAYSSRRTLH